MTVDEAQNGRDALVLLKSMDTHGVIMDSQMPVLDGLEATRQIRQSDEIEELPVIALTANAIKSEKRRILESGMNDIIIKPIDPNELFVILAEWIKPDAKM